MQLDLDEVMLDSSNLPGFNQSQFEGRIERPISKLSLMFVGIIFSLIILVFIFRLGFLQVVRGAEYRERSEDNTLVRTYIHGERGIIMDRNGVPLAWNDEGRKYTTLQGIAHTVGYISLPTEADVLGGTVGDLTLRKGKVGAEQIFEYLLAGSSGVKIEEVDVNGQVVGENMQQEASNGKDVNLSIDAELQAKMYESIARVAEERGFRGGAGVILDVKTGEIISMVSYPEFSLEEPGSVSDKSNPFLNRATSGLYAPGSIVKTFVAIGVLEEGIIDEKKEIESRGSISIANPYDSDSPSVFTDWKAHGWVNMIDAIAVSSNVYFYEVGGGFEGQKGLGIDNIYKYFKLFGFGKETGAVLDTEAIGVVPNPEWKEANFDGDPWRIGDTYYTSIGQYGFQATPLQVARAYGVIASKGHLVTPILLKSDGSLVKYKRLNINEQSFDVVHEGMRQAVLRGTAQALSRPSVKVAGKTGTAELGFSKSRVNSWVTGFFPFEAPRYSFAIVLESGSSSNLVGASAAMSSVLDWLIQNRQEYLGI